MDTKPILQPDEPGPDCCDFTLTAAGVHCWIRCGQLSISIFHSEDGFVQVAAYEHGDEMNNPLEEFAVEQP